MNALWTNDRALYVYPDSLGFALLKWPYSQHYVIQWVKELKIHLVETNWEVSQKSDVKIMTSRNKKRDQKLKQIKHSRKTPGLQLPRIIDIEWIRKKLKRLDPKSY